MKKKAFTLIELLVVIAIIAILAAILFPVFAAAKQSAKKTASLSSVKQIMTALIMYNGDNDDVQIPVDMYDRGDGYWNTWMEMVYPYVKNKQIFINSAAPNTYSAFGVTGVPATSKVVSHYVWLSDIIYRYYYWGGHMMFAGLPVEANAFNNGCSGLPAYMSCTGMARVADPANSAFLLPGYYVAAPVDGMVFGDAWSQGFDPNYGKDAPTDSKYYPFQEGANFGMVDSHAKWYSSKNFNGNASRPHYYNGNPWPSSPYMVVVD